VDDDGDGDTDCDDSDCDTDPICLAVPEVCDNATDDDLDGDTDCADADCVLLPSCDIAVDLPATGVTDCYDDETGAVIACAGTGQDGFYQAGGCTLTGTDRFQINTPGGEDDVRMPVDDTVTDMCTGLEWQRQRDDTNGDGRLGDNPATMDVEEIDQLPWCEAVEYCKVTLNSGGGFAGKTGWRYPNVREAHSLLSYARLTGNATAILHVTHPAQLLVSENLIDAAFLNRNGEGVSGECTSTVTAGAGAHCVQYSSGGIGTAVGIGDNVAIRAVRTADPP
jgi:hypothetical protein